MTWIGVLLVSPVWGALSAKFLLQGCLGLAQACVGLLSLVYGRVTRSTSLMVVAVSAAQVIFSAVLVWGGTWLVHVLGFGRTNGETVTYWLAAAVQSAVYLLMIPEKLRKIWRDAMVPGALEVGILERKLRDGEINREDAVYQEPTEGNRSKAMK
jgi:hypothetical protein